MSDKIEDLLRQRDEARARKDFARADAIRDQIVAAGYEVKDTPSGPEVIPLEKSDLVDPALISSSLEMPARLQFSICLLYEGFVSDVERFIDGLRAHCDLSSSEVIVVDNASGDRERLLALGKDVHVLSLSREVGWAEAKNAGLKWARGEIIIIADLSVEPEGDILSPLQRAFQDPTVALVGPFGLVSSDMRSWEPSDGPEVDAIEGYLMATRRHILAEGLFREKFKWYRNADLDLSFQIRTGIGRRAIVLPLSVRRHSHRGWEAVDEPTRDKLSRRNHYIFFDRWKKRPDLLLSHRA